MRQETRSERGPQLELGLLDPFVVVWEGINRGARVIFLGEIHDSAPARYFASAVVNDLGWKTSGGLVLAVELDVDLQEHLDVLNSGGGVTPTLRQRVLEANPSGWDSDGFRVNPLPPRANEAYLILLETAGKAGVPVVSVDGRESVRKVLDRFPEPPGRWVGGLEETPGDLMMAAWIAALARRGSTVLYFCGNYHAENKGTSAARVLSGIMPGKVWTVLQVDGNVGSYQRRDYGVFIDEVLKRGSLREQSFGVLDGSRFGVQSDAIIFHAGDRESKPVWIGRLSDADDGTGGFGSTGK